MIERKKKICKVCGKEDYIFSHGRCKACSKVSYKPIQRLSTQSKGKTPLKHIKPRSEARTVLEQEYKIICAEIDAEAKETGNLECFFCGDMVVKADHHHLDQRYGKNLTKKEWIVRVHRKCHMAYHNDPIEKIPWFSDYLHRLLKVSEWLYERECLKLDK